MTGDEEVEVGGEEVIDEKTLTKRDIHTLNEQRRRDVIKVGQGLGPGVRVMVHSSAWLCQAQSAGAYM